MRISRRGLWIAAACAVFGAAAAAGFTVAARVTPELLRVELEQRLAAVLGSPVHVESVGLGLGLQLRIIGRGVEAFPEPDGPALRVQRAVVELRPFAHLTGQRRVRSLALDGARLRLGRDAKGRWSPAGLAALLEPDAPEESGARRHPDEILSPLIVLEASARSLLESALPADRVELRGARIEWKGGAWDEISAEIHRRVLFGDTRLHLNARLADRRAAARGSLEIDGQRSRGGELRLAFAATDLDLATAAATPLAPDGALLRLGGRISGVAQFEAPSPGSARLELDFVGRDLRAPASAAAPELELLAARRLELGGTLEIDPQSVRLRGGKLRNDRLALRLEGLVERPLQASSQGELSLALDEVRLEDVRNLIAWLPKVGREEAETLLANLESGHLHRLELAGAASLGEWQEFLAGRSSRAPRDFALLSDLADVSLRAGEDRIEDLGGHLAWRDDRLDVNGLHARLGGRPLPVLDLEVDGISTFLGTDRERRRLTASAPPLAGLGALWKDLRPDDAGEEPGRMPVALGLEIDRLEHPMFLWPIEGLSADITPLERGVRIEARDGTWGGVPIEIAADWLFEPEERVVARVVAGPAESPGEADAGAADGGAEAPAAPRPERREDGWARGRLHVGAIDEARWKQRGATARFEAHGERLRLFDAHLDLAPHGSGVANAVIDLSRPGSAPFQLSFEIFDADLPTLGTAVRLPPDLATGHVDVAGSVEGSFDPATPIGATLEGLIEADARDGTLRKRVPAAMAVALASDMLTPLTKLERVRYERMRALLELGHGRLSTESLSVDGPDVRAFARGDVAIGEKPHAIDVELVLFLFRPMDWVLDKIPIVNFLLLGPNRNLIAAHYRLSGSWEEPAARLVPLQSFTRGPGTLVFERLPSIVERGLDALGGLIGRDRVAGPETPPPPEVEAPPPSES